MVDRTNLDRELQLLAREQGDDAAASACAVLAAVIRWLREEGHGNVALSAVGHRFSQKFRTETVVTVEKRQP